MLSANKIRMDTKIMTPLQCTTMVLTYSTYNLMMFKLVETVSEGWNS